MDHYNPQEGDPLTKAEQELYDLASLTDLTIKGLCKETGLAISTIGVRLSRVYRKKGVKNRYGLILSRFQQVKAAA